MPVLDVDLHHGCDWDVFQLEVLRADILFGVVYVLRRVHGIVTINILISNNLVSFWVRFLVLGYVYVFST